jgi:hypothetical protein
MSEDRKKESSESGRGPLVDVAQALSDVARSLEACELDTIAQRYRWVHSTFRPPRCRSR